MTDGSSRILLLGATGKTGQMILEQLVACQARPVLVGRNPKALQALADRFGQLEIAVADAQDAEALRAVIRPSDVLISTVGPFETLGKIPLAVAVEEQAHYLDTSGEPDFTDHVYATYEARLADSSQAIMVSCGFDFVPGQVVAGHLLEEFGDKVATLNVVYSTADGRFANLTTGTLNTFVKAITEQGTYYNDGRRSRVYFGADSYPIEVGGRRIRGIKVPTHECLEHPKTHPHLRNVNIYLAWFGYLGGLLAGFNRLQHRLFRIPGYRGALSTVLRSIPIPQRRSPDVTARDKGPTLIRAEAFDAGGALLGTSTIEGHNIYYYTGEIAAWTAIQLRAGHATSFGVTTPLRSFGLEALDRAHTEFGFRPVD